MENDIQIFLNAFPNELEEDIKTIFEVINIKTELYNGGIYEVTVNNEILHIPERIYYDDITENLEVELTEIQKQILNCFFTRHYNGYIRQKRINNIFNNGKIYNWVVPYIISLIGEYVVEIIDDIYKNIDLIDEIMLKEFIKNNEKFILRTEGRIASYYGKFYILEYNKNNYVGFKIKKYIQFLRKSLK